MLKRLKKLLLKRGQQVDALSDVAIIQYDGLTMIMSCQDGDSEPPYEFSMYIPRLEYRQKHYHDGVLKSEKEIILNSITIVHAPQHPPAEGSRNKGKHIIHHKMD